MTHPENYLLSVDLGCVPSLATDVLVIGSGVAGLSAALEAAQDSSVVLVTKSDPSQSNTYYAQGGVAVAMAQGDTPQSHFSDTIRAGVGLCDEDAVHVLVEDGPACCQRLIDWGAPFDRQDGKIAFTMEGAHSCRRVIHASGDATGKAIVQTLLHLAENHDNIQILDDHFAVDLLHHEGECYGAVLLSGTWGRLLKIESRATIVATGGLGEIYRETTNPDVATGDGLALCYRAGAAMRDMEFVQFHPTTLYLAGAPRFLISESVRGEGGYLVNNAGERFMHNYDDALELAPRDVVSRSILREMKTTNSTHVWLDVRHLGADLIGRRFPTIRALCADYGIDLMKDMIPVRPAAHYMMGGVVTDLNGATRIRRLFAAGEVASTGVHGANRLASNSLLEGLVFGVRSACKAGEIDDAGAFPLRQIRRRLTGRNVPLDLDDVLMSLKSVMWRNVGVFRDAESLKQALHSIRGWEKYVLAEQFQARGGFEVQNMLTVARLITHSALLRTESRGAHQRVDYTEPADTWLRHTVLTIDDPA